MKLPPPIPKGAQLFTRKQLLSMLILWKQSGELPTAAKPRVFLHFPEDAEFRLAVIDRTGVKSTDNKALYAVTFSNP